MSTFLKRNPAPTVRFKPLRPPQSRPHETFAPAKKMALGLHDAAATGAEAGPGDTTGKIRVIIVFTAVFFYTFSNREEGALPPVKIATWNVNGIRAREAQFIEWVEREQPDVVCLQEIKSPVAKVPASLCELKGYRCYWHGERGYSGVGLHIRRDAFADEPQFAHPDFDYETRIVAGQMGNLTVVSVYVPNGGKDFTAKMKFLHELERYVAGVHAADGRLVICGDINIARTERDVHPRERNPALIGQRPDEREIFERILALGLVDVGRTLDPDNDNLFTWWAPWRRMRERNIGWRLDYVLASRSLAAKAIQCTVYREIGTSDHAPVVAVFDLQGGAPAGESDGFSSAEKP